ncbi:acetate uptake transporter family protein [Pseudonocardia acidicola]|uniref:Succinate-acetate transporter protein n=1 Tax=Pseudonocardia acidicola TaxID=2724939 RepID=A0ABX1SE43_9PSEU|nr:GPR1/FUN34/YaaH family transporter [Pseudonocardia acidicola]NMH99082.1 hypothetical protein [Pseudonocardia acidicola]
MSVESDVQQAPGLSEDVAAVPQGNPALLGLITFLPAGITLGLWFIGYLDTATLAGGMVPIVSLSAGLFLLVASVWAARLGASPVSAIFGVFSAFWLSFGLLLIAATSGWWGLTSPAAVASTQRTYLLSFLIVFVLLTVITLRLPLTFTAGFVLVDITFALAFIGVASGNTGLFPIAGITTFLFCAVFAYILADGMGQDLGGKPMPLGNPLQR